MVIARAEVINWGRALRNGGGHGGGSLGVTRVAISVISEIISSAMSRSSVQISAHFCVDYEETFWLLAIWYKTRVISQLRVQILTNSKLCDKSIQTVWELCGRREKSELYNDSQGGE